MQQACCAARPLIAASQHAALRRHPLTVARAAAGGDPPPAPAVTRAALLKSTLLAAGCAGLAQQPSLAAAAAEAAGPAAAAAAGAVSAAAPVAALPLPASVSSVVLNTLGDCELAVSVYPTFGYHAAGGGGTGRAVLGDDGLLHVDWDPSALDIPSIDTAHASILGVPLPPPLRIRILPQRLSGTVDPATGEANLDFLARFDFSSDGVLRHGSGQRLSADGVARLVGVARVPPTGDAFLDGFLMLPTDALAASAVGGAQVHLTGRRAAKGGTPRAARCQGRQV
eukprot:scaffold8.g1513.t1